MIMLLIATKQLREAQKAYMADRGNEELGRRVARAAERVDHIIAGIEAELNSVGYSYDRQN